MKQQMSFNERWGKSAMLFSFAVHNIKCNLYSSEHQEILREMSQSGVIDMQSVNDDDLLQMEKLMNKDDQDLHTVFVEVGLFDQPDKSDLDEEQRMTAYDRCDDDYDVDDLLKDALSY